MCLVILGESKSLHFVSDEEYTVDAQGHKVAMCDGVGRSTAEHEVNEACASTGEDSRF